MKKRIFLRIMQVIGMIVTFFVAIAASGAAIDADLSWAWRFIEMPPENHLLQRVDEWRAYAKRPCILQKNMI